MATVAPDSSRIASAFPPARGLRSLAPPMRGFGPAGYEPPLRKLLSLRPWNTEVVIVIAYLVATRVGALAAAKIGFQAGPIPLFLTDLTLLSLIGLAVMHRGARLLFWASSGTQAGAAGFAAWLLLAIAVAYFLLAFPTYGIYAVRDLAIFGYSLFFPLTYFAISKRSQAVRAVRYFVYAGVVAAALILVQALTGLDLGFGTETRVVLGQSIAYLGSDDYGGVVGFSLVGLMAFSLLERKRKRLHIVALLLCFLALADTGTRSAFVGVMLAAVVTFMVVSHRHRLSFVVLAAVLAGALVLGAFIPDSFPGSVAMHKLYLAIASASSSSNQDANAAFRLVRWKDAISTWLENPMFGVGFGRDILHQVYLGDWSGEKFNMGMPHNTYLFLLARVGLVGFGLVAFCWIGGIAHIAAVARRFRRPDDLAALNILVAMAGFAGFVLFFERPMNNACFWIMLAIVTRLVETSSMTQFSRTGIRPSLNLFAQPRRETLSATRVQATTT